MSSVDGRSYAIERTDFKTFDLMSFSVYAQTKNDGEIVVVTLEIGNEDEEQRVSQLLKKK